MNVLFCVSASSRFEWLMSIAAACARHASRNIYLKGIDCWLSMYFVVADEENVGAL